ncbi:MAG TPA: SLC13 family permease [Candidatus Binatia bacterium]|nr:SLC13 family permease [Candidatus Binatia bacterium]
MADLAQVIRQIPLFSALSREDIAKVLGKMEERYYVSGTTIFSQGEQGDAFYLIQTGAVQVVLENRGRAEIIRVLGPQEWFGEMALLSGEPRSATIVALRDSLIWRLSRHAWDELIDKHPTWLLHFCAALSKKLSYVEQQYSQGREAFYSLAEEFYSSRPAPEQAFLRRLSLLTGAELEAAEEVLPTRVTSQCLATLRENHFPLVRVIDSTRLDLHPFFSDFLREKFAADEGPEAAKQVHGELAEQLEKLGRWQDAIHHCLAAENWPRAASLLSRHKQVLLEGSAEAVREAIEQLPRDQIDVGLVHMKAEALVRLGKIESAVAYCTEALLDSAKTPRDKTTANRLQHAVSSLARQGDYAQALNLLRNALELRQQEAVSDLASIDEKFDTAGVAAPPRHNPAEFTETNTLGASKYLLGALYKSDLSRWIGALLGIAVWSYLWFADPDIGLEPTATRQLAFLALTLIFWMFRVFPEYGVALLFAIGMIISGLARPEVVLSGFSSSSWFMTLGVLGLGAAITSSGLFYRLSLQLVRVFPLGYRWQIVAMGFMGIVVMALIPQQSARTAIISQMLMNLSESLGYKNPSKASTGLFVASFLGLGQLGFLFLTGSTTSLIAWGLLPEEVRAQFSWGYWFYAASVPTFTVVVIVIAATLILYKPESQARVSYKMVQTQLQILGPLSRHEWITLGVLCLTLGGWLSKSYHNIDGAWVALIALCVLINTGVLGWGMMKKGIDWEMLLYMGATLSIPALLTQAQIDQWLVGMFAPVILPFTNSPALCFTVIIVIAIAVKLAFTSFLTVVTLTVALLPLASELGISPWVMAMIVLMGSEVWFLRFQVDWHTMASATTGGKGFSYPMMYRINPVYAVAYVLAAIVAIPWWRHLGLIG